MTSMLTRLAGMLKGLPERKTRQAERKTRLTGMLTRLASMLKEIAEYKARPLEYKTRVAEWEMMPAE